MHRRSNDPPGGSSGRGLIGASTRWAALLVGGGSLALGILGLLPFHHTDWPDDAPELTVRNGYGYLLATLPNNLPLTLVRLAAGGWGVAAASRCRAARAFLRGAAILYGTLAVLGLVPAAQTVFGLLPAFGGNVWLHGSMAVVAAVAGWAGRPTRADRAPRRTVGAGAPVTIVGRPIHLLLAPFPIAFLSGAVATDLAFWWTTLPWYNGSRDFWAGASLWLLGSGLTMGLLAASSGLVDLLVSSRTRHAAPGRIHALGSFGVLALSLANVLLRAGHPETGILPWGILLSAGTALALVVTAWNGRAPAAPVAVGRRRPRRRRHPVRPPALRTRTPAARRVALADTGHPSAALPIGSVARGQPIRPAAGGAPWPPYWRCSPRSGGRRTERREPDGCA